MFVVNHFFIYMIPHLQVNKVKFTVVRHKDILVTVISWW